jgi:WhiB family transcriptional regulator, redox-sensing transcriptional regulator
MFDGLLEDDETPHQAPTLTLAEERHIDSETGRRGVLEWLMAGDGAPDIEMLLDELVRRPAWHQQAACRGVGADLFIIDRGTQYEESARQLCAGCSVHPECLDAALAYGGSMTGLWGGTTPTERRQMRRGRAVA